VLTAIGPEGQCRTDELRRAVAGGMAVAEIAERPARWGLTVPTAARATLAHAVSGVRWSLLASLALFGAAMAVAAGRDLVGGHDGLATPAAWFVLPVPLAGGTLLMARLETHLVMQWAAPAGQSVLRTLRAAAAPADPTLAVVPRGRGAVQEPLLRAALRVTHRVG
jgi:hypothetical protein